MRNAIFLKETATVNTIRNELLIFFKTKNPDEKFIRIVIDVSNEGLQISYLKPLLKIQSLQLELNTYFLFQKIMK